MQKLICFLVGSFIFAATLYANADLMAPSDAVISGDNAKTVQQTIVEITHAKPTEGTFGRKIVTADASVTCSQKTDGKVTCTIHIKK